MRRSPFWTLLTDRLPSLRLFMVLLGFRSWNSVMVSLTGQRLSSSKPLQVRLPKIGFADDFLWKFALSNLKRNCESVCGTVPLWSKLKAHQTVYRICGIIITIIIIIIIIIRYEIRNAPHLSLKALLPYRTFCDFYGIRSAVSLFANDSLLQVYVFSHIFPIQAVPSCSLRPASVICTHLCPNVQSVLFLYSKTNLCIQFNSLFVSRPTRCTNSYNVSLFLIKCSTCIGVLSPSSGATFWSCISQLVYTGTSGCCAQQPDVWYRRSCWWTKESETCRALHDK